MRMLIRARIRLELLSEAAEKQCVAFRAIEAVWFDYGDDGKFNLVHLQIRVQRLTQ